MPGLVLRRVWKWVAVACLQISIKCRPSCPITPRPLTYVFNSPLKYMDPSGHGVDCGIGTSCVSQPSKPSKTKPCARMPDCGVNNTPGLSQSSVFLRATNNERSGYDYLELDPKVHKTPHPGIDFNDVPNPTIYASGNGIVIAADACSLDPCIGLVGYNNPNVNGGYGNVVIIEYPAYALPQAVVDALNLSPGASLFVLYAHLASAPTLLPGDTVYVGQPIGSAGNTGNSDGAHLHMEVRVGPTNSLVQGVVCSAVCVDMIANYQYGDPNTVFSPYRRLPTINPNTLGLYYLANSTGLSMWR